MYETPFLFHSSSSSIMSSSEVSILLVFLFVFTFVTAQTENPSSPSMSPPPDQSSVDPRFNPSIAIVMVVLLGSLFLMGFCSVYIRHLANRRYVRSYLDPFVASANIGGRGGGRRFQGLDSSVIDTFPTFPYSSVKNLKIGKGALECAVCLNEFEDDETLRLIPNCSHVFHPQCIDAWLSSHSTCPVCRANLVPKPDDMLFGPVLSVEPDRYAVEPDHRAEPQNQVVIQVVEDDRRVPVHPQASEVNLLNPMVQNRPPRSWSTSWRFNALFPRSHSTGHSLVQQGENLDRFTLRIPEEIQSQLLNTHLNRAKSCVAFPRARSMMRGYRSGSGGIRSISNNFHYERFGQEGQPNRFGFSTVQPFVSRSGSVQSSKGVGGSDGMDATPPKSFSKSLKSPFGLLFLGIDGCDNAGGGNQVGERPSDRIRPESQG